MPQHRVCFVPHYLTSRRVHLVHAAAWPSMPSLLGLGPTEQGLAHRTHSTIAAQLEPQPQAVNSYLDEAAALQRVQLAGAAGVAVLAGTPQATPGPSLLPSSASMLQAGAPVLQAVPPVLHNLDEVVLLHSHVQQPLHQRPGAAQMGVPHAAMSSAAFDPGTWDGTTGSCGTGMSVCCRLLLKAMLICAGCTFFKCDFAWQHIPLLLLLLAISRHGRLSSPHVQGGALVCHHRHLTRVAACCPD